MRNRYTQHSVIALSSFTSASSLTLSAALIFFVVFAAGVIGPRLFRPFPRALQWIFGGASMLAVQSVLQTIWYYAGGHWGAFSDVGTLLTTLIFFAGILWWDKQHRQYTEQTDQSLDDTPLHATSSAFSARDVSLASVSLVSAGIASAFLLTQAAFHATIQSANAPWALLPVGTFLAFSVLGLATFLATSTRHRWLVMVGAMLSLGTLATLTILLFPLGYGFDGFLHRASEALLLTTGTLHPIPPAYMGQYALITWLARVVHIPFAYADRWLIVVLAGLLPWVAWPLTNHRRRGSFAVFALLLTLPLSLLATTTPQAVAFLLGLYGLLWLIPNETRAHATHAVVPWFFLTWSLATHPLAGLPFFFVAAALHIEQWKHVPSKLKRTIIISSWVGAVIAVPVAFGIRNRLQTGTWSWSWLAHAPGSIVSLFAALAPPVTHLALWPDWASWQHYAQFALLLAAAGFAVYQDHARRKTWITLLAFSGAALISSWLLQQSGDFSFLISYERQDYATRLITVAQLILVPVAMIGIRSWHEQIAHTHPRTRTAALLFAIAWFSASVYNALPRNDAAEISHGWNVGKSDLETVDFIDQQAHGANYTVLANQTVSAASISRFGFKRYAGDVFYYPIPTGGPLYQDFVQMMNEPNRDIAREAGVLSKSERVYVVVNQYWDHADRTIETLKQVADRIWNVENGTAYIFLFDFSNSVSAVSSTSTTR